MLISRRFLLGASALALTPALTAGEAAAASAHEIERDARAGLAGLEAGDRVAAALAKQAVAILVFPRVVKAGLIVGGEYGEGLLLKGGEAHGFFRIAAGSVGLQAGAQAFGYALFFMNDRALGYLDRSDGWEVGVGPTLTVIDRGVAGSFSTTTAKDDIYAFFFDQQGLMAGVSVEGSKITRFTPGA